MDDLIIHLEKGAPSFMGLQSHSYRYGACGLRVERWLSTANTEFTVKDVNCKLCLRTKMYKKAKAA